MTRSTRPRDDRSRNRVLGAIGAAAAILTMVGLSGVGDAPAPFAEARSMAEHFRSVRTDVFVGAVFGAIGVAAMTAFVFAMASRFAPTGKRGAVSAVGVGLLIVDGYLLATHTVYTTLSYAIAATSEDVTKGMFVATILAVPVFGLGVATLLVGAAIGSWQADIMPPRWRAATLALAAVAAVAVFSYADRGIFSPDVHQQVVANSLIVWLLATSAVCAATRHHDTRRGPVAGRPTRSVTQSPN
jgi:hypothetical protein